MRQHRDREGLDVVRKHEIAFVECCVRPAGPQQMERGSRRRAETQLRGIPGGGDDVDDVLPERGRYVDLAHGSDQCTHVTGVRDGLELVER